MEYINKMEEAIQSCKTFTKILIVVKKLEKEGEKGLNLFHSLVFQKMLPFLLSIVTL